MEKETKAFSVEKSTRKLNKIKEAASFYLPLSPKYTRPSIRKYNKSDADLFVRVIIQFLIE